MAIDSPALTSSVSEARLASVLDTAVDGIIVIDAQCRILMFNKACERMFGFTAAELLGQNVKMIMPLEYAKEHDRYVADYLRTGVRKIIGIGREVHGRHRDGTIFPVELSVGETHTPDGPQFIGLLRDITRRKETEQRLNQLQGELLHMARVSAMDEMGAAIAHELNQPLTAVMLYLQAAKRATEKEFPGGVPESVLSIWDKAVREAERAGQIIQRMRQFIEKHEPTRRLVDINPLVDEAIELTMVGRETEMRLIRDLAPDLPQLYVDPIQIQQIIVNLLRNALDAVRGVAGSTVRITTRHVNEEVVVSVEDNGPGIAPELVPNLFKAFTSSRPNGVGLGLVISRTIAQNHRGDLTVDPGGNGRGASFTLHLPLPGPEET